VAVPSFEKFLLPVLRHTSDGEPHRSADTLASALAELKLDEADLSERLLNGRTRVMDRTLWAITYLRKKQAD
jgi:restriction endonuclease Mrr